MKKFFVLCFICCFAAAFFCGCLLTRSGSAGNNTTIIDDLDKEIEALKAKLLIVDDKQIQHINSNSYFDGRQFAFLGGNEKCESWDRMLCIGYFADKQVLITKSVYQSVSEFRFNDKTITTSTASTVIILYDDGTFVELFDSLSQSPGDYLSFDECDVCVGNYENHMRFYELCKLRSSKITATDENNVLS